MATPQVGAPNSLVPTADAKQPDPQVGPSNSSASAEAVRAEPLGTNSTELHGYVYTMDGAKRFYVRVKGWFDSTARATAIDMYVAAVKLGFPIVYKIHERTLLLMMSRPGGFQQPMCPDRTLAQNMFDDEECEMHLYISAAAIKQVPLPHVVVVIAK